MFNEGIKFTNEDKVKLKELIAVIMPRLDLDEKTEKYIGRHGSSKDDEETHTFYWDELRLEWTTKELAIEGFVFSNLRPLIKEIIKSDGIRS